MSRNLVNLIRGKQWYHQRFDGTPMFLDFIGEAEVKKEKRKPSGTEADIRVCFYSQGRADWYLAMDDIKRGYEAIIRLAKKDPNISKKLLAAWRADEKAFEDFFWQEFPKINLKKLTGEELIKLWSRYKKLAINRFTSSSVIDHFALGTDELIGQMIKNEAGKLPKQSQFVEIFSAATAPVHQSFINQAEIDLLKIALKKSKEKLEDYQKRYFWIQNNYTIAQNLSIGHFKKEIKIWRQSGKNLEEQLRKIQNTPALNKFKKQKLFKKYHFSKLLRTLLKISEDFTWWQDERKKATFLNIHIGKQILDEVGRRTGYKFDELKYAVTTEVESILKYKKPKPAELQKRQNYSVVIVTRDGYVIKTGKEAENVRRIMFGTKKLDEVQDIRGLSASMGRVIGLVKVVRSATEISKVKAGDILVAVMTRPDYVTAMKKAAAIVTDEGGITSHAAIVSRELGIPCIIGTKIATEVLKDGDRVEVNANHGWVRKINV